MRSCQEIALARMRCGVLSGDGVRVPTYDAPTRSVLHDAYQHPLGVIREKHVAPGCLLQPRFLLLSVVVFVVSSAL